MNNDRKNNVEERKNEAYDTSSSKLNNSGYVNNGEELTEEKPGYRCVQRNGRTTNSSQKIFMLEYSASPFLLSVEVFFRIEYDYVWETKPIDVPSAPLRLR